MGIGDWGLGIRNWGLETGDWGLKMKTGEWEENNLTPDMALRTRGF